MQQQRQILQSLNQCYAQLQQQHQDMATLQQQFQQLFTYNPSALGDSNPSPHTPQVPFPNVINNTSPASFRSLPSVLQPPFSAPLFTQVSFTSGYQPPSSAPMFRTAWHPTGGQQVCSCYKLSKRLSGSIKVIFGLSFVWNCTLCGREWWCYVPGVLLSLPGQNS